MNRALRFTLLGLAVVVASACAGTPAPEKNWAQSACAAFLPYIEGMLEAYETARHEGAVNASTAQSIATAVELTDDLVLRLQAIPAPATTDGRGPAVKGALVAAAMQTQRDLAAFRTDPSKLGPSLGLAESESGRPELQTVIAVAAFSPYAYVELSARTVPRPRDAGRYTDAIEAAASCKELNAAYKSAP